MKKYLITLLLVLVISGLVFAEDAIDGKVVNETVVYQNGYESSNIIGTLLKNSELLILETDGEWSKVQLTGWVKTEDVQVLNIADYARKMVTYTGHIFAYGVNVPTQREIVLDLYIGRKTMIPYKTKIIQSSGNKELDNEISSSFKNGVWIFKEMDTPYKITVKVIYVPHKEAQVEYLNLTFFD